MRRRKPVKPKLATAVPAEWVSELRRGSRVHVMRWGLHALVLSVLVIVPYARGQWRARAIQQTYARAAACMYGGTASHLPGTAAVADPSGYYAAMFLQRTKDWPARCEEALRGLAEAPASLVFPSVKAAEANVQKAAQIVLTEISNLPPTLSQGARIPLRPLWGLEMLRTAVAADADAAGVTTSTSAAAIGFSARRTAVPTPSLLNIDAAPNATIKLWGDDAELQVAAFDTRGVSYMRLMANDMTRARLPRSGTLRSVVRQSDAEYLVWMTSVDKCGIGHCAGRSTGLSPMPVPLTKIPEPRWVAAHPFGNPERSLAWRGARMWMAAARLDGTAQLVEFNYDTSPAVEGKAAPAIVPEPKGIGGARDLVVFSDGSGQLGALALLAGVDGRAELVLYRDGKGKQGLITLPEGWSSGWVRTCSASSLSDLRYFVVGNSTQTLVGYVRDDVTKTWPVLATVVPAPRPTDQDPGVASACADATGVTIAFIEANGTLESVTCARDQTVCMTQPLSEFATSVAVTYTSDEVIVAYAAAPEQPQVRLRRTNAQGVAIAEAAVPGPCWERWGGMCGAPTFAWAGERLVLAARSGPNLMALESANAGKSWSELGSTSLVKPPGPHVLPRLQ